MIESRHCGTHGDYTASLLRFGSRELWSDCPECASENLAKPRLEVVTEQRDMAKNNARQKIASSFRDSGIPPRYTTRNIDNFNAITPAQKKALSTVTSYIANIPKVVELGTSMIITGDFGTGKTHLACAIGNEFVKENRTIAFMTVSTMFRRIRETYRSDAKKTEDQVIKELRNADLFVLDEIGVQKGSESEENLLFEVLNERYCYFKPTIMISNLSVDDMRPYVGGRIMDRLKEGGGKLVVCDWESYRAKVVSDVRLPSLSGSKY